MATIQAAKNKKETNIRVKLNISLKVILTVNIDIQDRRTKSQTENLKHIEFDQGRIGKAYVKFSDEQDGLKAIKNVKLRQKRIIKNKLASSFIKYTQFSYEQISIFIHQIYSIFL